MACFMAKICPSQEPHLFSLLLLLPIALLLPDLAEGEDEVISKEIVELEKNLTNRLDYILILYITSTFLHLPFHYI